MKHIFRFVIVLILISYFTVRESALPHAYIFNSFIVLLAGIASYMLYRRDIRKKEEKLAKSRNRK